MILVSCQELYAAPSNFYEYHLESGGSLQVCVTGGLAQSARGMSLLPEPGVGRYVGSIMCLFGFPVSFDFMMCWVEMW